MKDLLEKGLDAIDELYSIKKRLDAWETHFKHMMIYSSKYDRELEAGEFIDLFLRDGF